MSGLIDAMIADGDCPPGVIEDALKDADPDWQEGAPLATVYVVRGYTEQGCDHEHEWDVAAFLVEEKAERSRAAARPWCERTGSR